MQYQTNYPYATTSQQYGAISNRRDEQRRRQQEYSQALAKQVAQREQQKRREREMDQQYRRHSGAFPNPFNQNFRQEAFASAERGILDGLGHNNPQNTRKSFARGQPQLHHRLPGGPESFDYSQASNFPPAQHRPSVDNQTFQSGFGYPGNMNQQHPMAQQSWQQQQSIPAPGTVGPPPFPGSNVQAGWGVQNPQLNAMPQAVRNDLVAGPPPFAPGPSIQTGWQNPQQNPMAQARNSQYWAGQSFPEQPVPSAGYAGYASPQRPNYQSGHPYDSPPGPPNAHNAGRRLRTGIHDGDRGDAEERFRRKQQQQHEMQLALERQIEEKRQQKLEAKRRQEEEDRRELERFEEEQRRLRAEQERLQEEKRRKAELEQQKADQAAAAVAAANQQAKLQQQHKLHAQLNQPQPQHIQSFQQHYQPPPQQPEHFPNAPSPDRSKNPFTNSRAHLFEDPPPPRESMAPSNHHGYSNQNASPIRGHPQSFGPAFEHDNNMGRLLDPMELRHQYDDMREELSRQKQLVDQLRQAQAQIQQRSPVRVESGNIPTLIDLEKLRNELRGELAYREQIHRQELESLKREQQQERPPTQSPHRHSGVKDSLELQVRIPNKVERISSHPETIKAHEVSRQQRGSPNKIQHPFRSSTEELSHHLKAPISESAMSLRGESRFVYFNVETGGNLNGDVGDEKSSDNEQDGDALDEQSESIKVEAPLQRKSIQKSVQFSPTRKPSIRQSVAVTRSVSPRRPIKSEVSDTDSDGDDDRGFVVTGITSSPSHQLLNSPSTSRSSRSAASSHRYSQLPPALSSFSPSKASHKWRLESMGTTDSNDDLDESLDGDQLEALFQRNVRRHEILLGFQSKLQGQPQDAKQRKPDAKLAWAELHQQLESNRRALMLRKLSTMSTASNDSNQETIDNEAALVASSKWVPSTVLSTRRRNVVNN
ncbi:hypothetical protein PPTG_16232 [Phytophthora nicotianae INRA-310]|uniref:Uncharacterized protein n=1 Tax=Phytophthora nicotianae (strain INRA-310) TaxID=761204 RepID=W2PPS1_PHYN3|nr:hypothetical protein PPTG_16232 [Phytophthora nicotianae INRA-310]ETN02626.1 hypothetical protein PPTG_16232 [Phytophthora nicotianae INRA-310]